MAVTVPSIRMGAKCGRGVGVGVVVGVPAASALPWQMVDSRRSLLGIVQDLYTPPYRAEEPPVCGHASDIRAHLPERRGSLASGGWRYAET
jgi:hypothetical protein